MSKLATVIKEEVSRLSRKEAKASSTPIKRRVLALEKLVREQRRALKDLAQRVESTFRVQRAPEASSSSPADRARLTPRSIKAVRKRLGLSQMEFAKLTGVTHVAVYLWESGKTKPRGASREALLKARQLGVRDARRQLDEFPATKPTRKARQPNSRAKEVRRRRRRAGSRG